MDVVLPRKVADIGGDEREEVLGNESHSVDLILFGIHSTKYEEFVAFRFALKYIILEENRKAKR
jgi:hypothetical protein